MTKLLLSLLTLLVLSQLLEALFLTHLTGDQFLSKIGEGPLDPTVVFKYIEKVRAREEVAIGSTNLQQLHNIHAIESENCFDYSYKKRLQICSAAEEAQLDNINRYCKGLASQLTQHCSDLIELLITDSLISIEPVTLDFFRALMKDHFHDKPENHKSIIDEHLGGVWDGQQASRLNQSCTKLINCFSSIGSEIDQVIEVQAGLGTKLSSKAAGWTNAYKLCQYFEERRRRAAV